MNSPSKADDHPMQYYGRFGRLAFAAWLLFTSIIALFSFFMLISLFTQVWIIIILFLITFIGFAYLGFVFTIRRLHDCNQSGWLSLLTLVPYLNIPFFIYLILMPGTKGQNQYGTVYPTQTWEKICGWIYIILMLLLHIIFIISLFYVQELQQQFLQQEFPSV